MMPLAIAKVGEINTIKRINGQDETKRFLENLGFIVDDPITVISKMGGNIIVTVKGTRVAISQNMANRIIV
ncbi:FeoA family protein [Acetobacterium woodii]|uniref:Ferrous iron transport protein FeoA n=1 Tax=Acetobacterium woodii (strain ATCC 29683 / DSM 1030 / JCM 2381 / KCTC 1655 / WB1) TaxID=931626 RepID=H6LHX9_ACEWD|nr:ferrous iron transport protein FeoA [Acetobacterium woodii DSM 1030]